MPVRVSLTTRVTAFSLAALALVLSGFSATIYLVARSDLSRQADARLDAALSTLLAAVEVDADGLEWEPGQRLLAFGRGPEPDEVRWAIQDGRGAPVADSTDPDSARLLARLPLPRRASTCSYRRARLDGRPWRVVRRRLGSNDPAAVATGGRYPALTFSVALPLDPIDATERHLGRLLAGVSAGVWLLAAASGRWFCRRALGPLARMAGTARDMGAAEPDRRLPDPGTGDELHDLADAFNGLLDRLHEAFARQARFTGDASHQLRTPLAVMLGQIDVALRRDRPADDYRHTLALVRDQAARLGRIVEMLLFLARADAEAKLPDRQVIDLATWARDHLAGWTAHPRSADITVEAPGDPIPVRVHPPLLGQLLDNLLDNACKYGEPGTPVVIRAARPSPGLALLSVRDRGPGIAPEDLPHVFDPFFRSPLARRRGLPGVGLGLTIARRIADSLDGRLDARDTPEGGTEFILSLAGAAEVSAEAVATGR